ncbi:hypothetical protein AMTR_s00053p00199020 [Amborella trichopoda]|uniref:Uncharacterized protein n=1 Tax=Amborella trichopoda TaxID=13333 RepID=W1PBU1_AMBTC|nr:hypothetical protein AMTR_s00053p00199020 [Amborella trichopoda]
MPLSILRPSWGELDIDQEEEVKFITRLNLIPAEEVGNGGVPPPMFLGLRGGPEELGVRVEEVLADHAGGEMAVVVAAVGSGEEMMPKANPEFSQKYVAEMFKDMRVDLEVPFAVIYEAIRRNGSIVKKEGDSGVGYA